MNSMIGTPCMPFYGDSGKRLRAVVRSKTRQGLCTLSALQMHPHAVIIADEAAVDELKVSTYRYFKDIEKDNL